MSRLMMRTGNYPYTLLLLLVVCMMTGCGDRARENSFNEIESRISTDPRAAVQYVDSLAADSTWSAGMSKAERARFDLLRVKSADKAYVRHTSDSLIRTVLGYYEKHRGSEQYPEALYYGGRVYSDLGDSPTALRYFQKAIIVLETKEMSNNKLLTKVLSQTARLLNSRRLYKDAIPYIDKAVEIETQEQDSIGLMYDIEFAGAIRMHAGYYDEASRLFRKSMAMAVCRDTSFAIQNKMQLAAIKYYKKENDSALALIRELPNIKDLELRRTILTYASDIYLRAGITDTAFRYAKELLSSPKANERKHGYQVILDPRLSAYIPEDSSRSYLNAYRGIVEDNWDQSENKEINIQNSQFNYKFQEKRCKAAEENVHDTNVWLAVSCFFVFVLILLLVWMRIRNIRQRSELIKAKRDIEILRKSLSDINQAVGYVSDYAQDIEESQKLETAKTTTNRVLRVELRDKLYALSLASTTAYRVPSEILESEAYKKICSYLVKEHQISDTDEVWDELKNTVIEHNEKFLYHLNLLMGEEVRETHLRVCLLIKCGMTPKQMGILLGRSSGAISSRREQLCIRIFGKRMGNKVIDDIIRLM